MIALIRMSSHKHHFILGTFRHPYLYSFSFDPQTHVLVLEEKIEAAGGHSWLHLSGNKKYLYATGWTDPPSLAAYRICDIKGFPTVELINTSTLEYTSGYVTSNGRAVFSASGPQGDVFRLDASSGGFRSQFSDQSVRFDGGAVKNEKVLDFGGLRHGGHVRVLNLVNLKYFWFRCEFNIQSADISPDGTKLYIADMSAILVRHSGVQYIN